MTRFYRKHVYADGAVYWLRYAIDPSCDDLMPGIICKPTVKFNSPDTIPNAVKQAFAKYEKHTNKQGQKKDLQSPMLTMEDVYCSYDPSSNKTAFMPRDAIKKVLQRQRQIEEQKLFQERHPSVFTSRKKSCWACLCPGNKQPQRDIALSEAGSQPGTPTSPSAQLSKT